MRRLTAFLVIIVVVFANIPIWASEKAPVVLHVKINGSDNNSGTLENPLQTIDGARKMVRKIAKEQPIEVLIHGGVYKLSDTIAFDGLDSGTEQYPVTYKAYGDGEVIISGSKEIDISKFRQVTAPEMLSRLPASSVGRVGQLNLSEQGFSQKDFELVTNDGRELAGRFSQPLVLNFYLNNREQQLAKWPNKNYATIGNVLSNNMFEYTDTQPSRWTKAKDAYIAGYLTVEYTGGWLPLASVNTENRTITVGGQGTQIRANHRYQMVNLPEELDIPSEWYLDRQTMMLYYYPEKLLEPNRDVFEYPILRQDFISLNNAQNIIFDGLTLEKGGNSCINGRGSFNITVRNCTIREFANRGIIFISSKKILIDNNTVYNTGYHNISVTYYTHGGYPQEELDNLISTENVIRNNHCYNSGKNGIGMIGSVDVSGNDFLVENNTIHKGLNSGVIGVGRESKIRYNEIFDMVRETADAGAIYCGRSWVLYGPQIEYNYIHDLGDKEFNAGNLVDCIFWDDTISGQSATFNILQPNSKTRTYGLISGGGRDNVVSHNIIVDSDQSIGMQDRTTSLPDVRKTYNNGVAWEDLTKYATAKTEYTRRYPQLVRSYNELLQSGVFYPHYNKITHNVIVNALDINYSNAVKNSETTTMEGNIVADRQIFVDPENQDFRIKKSAKEELGLDKDVLDEDFDITKIGMQREMIELPNSFEKTYPKNGDRGLDAQNMQLSWQSAPFADEYDYVIAKDPELKEVVKTGTTIYTNETITGLDKSTSYYWSVKAKIISRANNKTWEAEGPPFLFTTASYDILTTDNLNAAIKRAQQYLDLIDEGEQPGKHKIGTREVLNDAIEVAKYVAKMTSGLQMTINNAEGDLKNALETAKSSINIQYGGTIDFTKSWVTNTPSDIELERNGDELAVRRLGGNGMAASESFLPGHEIYTFMLKSTTNNGWFAFGLRHSNYKSNNIYSAPDGLSNYFIIVKPDVFELQSRNSVSAGSTLMVIAENNGIFKEDQWNKIEFGAVPLGMGVLCVLKVNDQTVYEYLDQVNPVRTEGAISIQPASNEAVYLKPYYEATVGPYTAPSHVFEEAERLPIYYTTESPEYRESGKWAPDSDKGYENKPVRTTQTLNDYAQFSLNPSDSWKTYKVYYYHNPMEDGDKNATIEFSNLYVSHKETIDMTQGEKGFKYIGTFPFIDEGAKATMFIKFISSGQGKLPVSAIRIELTDNDESELEIISEE